jgi:hypothetical protein
VNFALCPDGGVPRLIRFVAARDMPADNVVATLDPNTNVLRIDQEVYFLMDPVQQHILIRTLKPITLMDDVNFGD